jgi:hypothetical protein
MYLALHTNPLAGALTGMKEKQMDGEFQIDEAEAEVVYDALPGYLNGLQEWIDSGQDLTGWGANCVRTGRSLYARLRRFRFPEET